MYKYMNVDYKKWRGWGCTKNCLQETEMVCMGNLDVEGPLAHLPKLSGGGVGFRGCTKILYCCS